MAPPIAAIATVGIVTLALFGPVATLADTGDRPSAIGACNGSFAGAWRTSYGIVRFRVEGGRVWGEHANGYIRGWITGNVLDADWVEVTDFGQGIGSLRLAISESKREFTGTWRRLSGIGISAGQWNGKCIAGGS